MQNETIVEKPGQDQIDQWKKEHGEVLLVCVDNDEYYFKKPTRPQYKRFIDTIGGGKLTDGLMTLIADCLLWPSTSEVNRRVEKNLQLPALLSGEIQKAAGGDATVFSKKL